MSSSLDKSLDDIIRQRKNQMQPAGRRPIIDRAFGQGDFGPGPDRQFLHHQPRHFRLQPYPTPALSMPMSVQTLSPAGGGTPSSTRLYISNLDRGVSDTDIMVLFSELGELRRYCVHYDSHGRSLGTAEVVYERHEDAISAIKRYNNVNLDGKPLKIELVGPPPPSPPMRLGATANIGWPNLYLRSDQENLGANRGNGGGGAGCVRSSGTGRGRARGKRQGKQQAKSISAEELDADLEKYQFEARELN